MQRPHPRHMADLATAAAMRRLSPVLLLPCLALLGACTALAPLPCRPDQQTMSTEHLYFGTARPDGQVSEQQWRTFLEEVVTPEFPQGLTVWQASGQWKPDAGPIVREGSYVLNIVHPDTEVTHAAITRIMNDYKRRFQQEAVLRVQARACVSF